MPFSGCASGLASGIALDASGMTYVTGRAIAGLPTRSDAYQPTPGNVFAPFVAKLDTTQSGDASLVFATYVSAGGFFDGSNAIAVDPQGNVYITGETSGPFPTTPDALQPDYSGNGDGFVAQLNPTGTALLYSTYLGGGGTDVSRDIAVDGHGRMYVTGNTDSTNFPVANAYQPAYGGSVRDAFVTVICGPVDVTPPSVEAVLSQQPNGAGWHRVDVTVTLQATDAGSGVKAITYATGVSSTTVDGASAAIPLTAEGATTIAYFAVDNAGNAGAPETITVNIDKTVPVVQCGASDGAWHADDVAVPCTAGDGLAGLANAADASFSLVTTVAPGVETIDAATGQRMVCDVAGNCATAGPVANLKVDKKAPVITVSAPAGDGSYSLNELVVARYACADGGSGERTCAGLGARLGLLNTFAVGAYTFRVNATDQAGNSASLSVPYTVSFKIRSLRDERHVYHRGSTVPFELQVTDNFGINRSAASLRVRVVGVRRPPDSTPVPFAHTSDLFSFVGNGWGGEYRYSIKTAPLCLGCPIWQPGSYVLLFEVDGDPLVHQLSFELR